MKTIFRFLAFAMLLTAFSVATVTTTFAQDDAAEKAALYKIYTDNYNGDAAKQKIALDAAKKYVEKYGASGPDKEQVDYFKAAIPDLEKGIAAAEKAALDAADLKNKQAGYKAFNEAVTAKNTTSIFTTGKAVLAKEPDFLDVNIVLANAGFDEVLKDPKSTTYNSDVINYATIAIKGIEAGKPSKNYGALSYALGDKNNALRILNYIVGYTMFVNQGKKQEALPYFYKSAKLESKDRSIPLIHQAVGSYYLDEAIKINTVRLEKIKELNNVDNEETLAMEANQRGYADRAIDSYARAYKLVKDDPKQKKEYKDGLYTKLKELYTFRYNNNEGIDAFVAGIDSKPLPDPSTPITPVKVEIPVPATAPTTTTGTTTTPATAPTTKPATAPATTPAVKPTPKPAATPAAPTAETTVKPATVKKPAPKKKGTR